MSNQNIYKMNLHDVINLDGGGCQITRVASGWIYEFIPYNGYIGGMVFVPYDNSFQGVGISQGLTND